MSIFSNICFYGGGAWGQALALTLASIGHKSTLIVSDEIRAKEINSGISRRFSQIKLSPLITSSVNAKEVIKESNLVFITTESKRVMSVIEQINLLNNNEINIVITSKGFANKHGETFNEIIQNQFPTLTTGILTGPTFADEIANNFPAAAILASNHINIPEGLAIGVLFGGVAAGIPEASIAGAVAHIIAIGAGIIEGLNLGDNAKAALITRGISETSRLIKASGGNYETAFGLAGIGDMSLTCGGPHSRNMAYGINLVQEEIKIRP